MIRDQIASHLKQALMAQDKKRLATLRLMAAALKDKDIAERSKGITTGIDDTAILQMLQTMVKQRNDSVDMYLKGGREDLAQKEKEEIAVIQEFLPQQMDESAIKTALQDVAKETGATSPKDMGALMGIMKSRYVGQMDFGLAARLAKEVLTPK
jgi:uncharacterized protein YqeY